MDTRTISQIDLDDPHELRRYEDRLKKRLQRFGYHISKGRVEPTTQRIRLKRWAEKQQAGAERRRAESKKSGTWW